MSKELVAGVDIGTSGVRCLVFDRDGAVLSTSYREYPTISERAGWAELDPEAILGATVTVIAQAAQAAKGTVPDGEIEAVGLSSALFSVMAVDTAGRPLTRVLPWMDNRAAGEAAGLVEAGLAPECYQRTGCRVHPMYPLSKLLWLKVHSPELWKAAGRFISIKEHVVEQLTGERAVDYSVASSSGYFNIHSHTWDESLLSLLGLEPEKLSPPVDATAQARLTPAAAERLGLKAGTPLVWGAGDGMLAHLASGCFEPTRFSSTIGTSGALRVLARRPLLDEQARTWCYCFDAQTWVAGGAINNGGLVLRWLRDQIGVEERRLAAERGVDPYEVMCEVAATVPAGADGLVMLPFLTGERSPNWNASAKGVLYGLQLHHTRAHLIRAGLEAVIYRMLSVYEALRSLAGQEGEIWANGGYTRSPLWVQIQADVFQRPVLVPRVTEASAFGAAMVAMKSAGLIGDYRDLEPAITVERSFRPDAEQAPAYRKAFELFQSLYDDVKHEFGRG